MITDVNIVIHMYNLLMLLVFFSMLGGEVLGQGIKMALAGKLYCGSPCDSPVENY